MKYVIEDVEDYLAPSNFLRNNGTCLSYKHREYRRWCQTLTRPFALQVRKEAKWLIGFEEGK